MIGFAANCILPARLGEIIRANTWDRETHQHQFDLGTIVVERILMV